jgi:hypothetical protein
MQATGNLMEWLSEHWAQMLGWSALTTFLYRLYIVASRFVDSWEGIKEARKDLSLIKDNHLTHLQLSMDKLDDNITGLREDLKDGLFGLREDIRLVLMRME